MRDIEESEDIVELVDAFYSKAIADPTIGFIFKDHMPSSLEAHLPKIYSFWQSVLLGTMTYRGNVMIRHLELNKRIKLEELHFNQWLLLWNTSVDKLFVGKKAEEAKQRAQAMKDLMLYKIGLSNDKKFIS